MSQSLDSSLSVFDPEVMEGSGGVAVRDRAALVDGLGLGETASTRAPLLAEILRLSKVDWILFIIISCNSPHPTTHYPSGTPFP